MFQFCQDGHLRNLGWHNPSIHAPWHSFSWNCCCCTQEVVLGKAKEELLVTSPTCLELMTDLLPLDQFQLRQGLLQSFSIFYKDSFVLMNKSNFKKWVIPKLVFNRVDRYSSSIGIIIPKSTCPNLAKLLSLELFLKRINDWIQIYRSCCWGWVRGCIGRFAYINFPIYNDFILKPLHTKINIEYWPWRCWSIVLVKATIYC